MPPAMAHNPAPEMSQAGLARESGERDTAQSPLPTFLNPTPSVPAAIPKFCYFSKQYEGGVENSKMIEIDERPQSQRFRLPGASERVRSPC